METKSPLSDNVRQAFFEHSLAEYPREACGLICVVKGRERYIPCRNIAANPEQDFVLSPVDYAMAEEAGEIIAIAHSHPDESENPSATDRLSCEKSEVPWHIVRVDGLDREQPTIGPMSTLEPTGYKPPLVGRPFIHGLLDCYALVRDYYIEQHGITFKDYYREDGWWDRGQNLYMENFETEGFVKVQDSPRPSDLILMQIRSKVPNHAAVYLGDELILHHIYGRLSSRDPYGGYWQEVTTSILRHKDLMNV